MEGFRQNPKMKSQIACFKEGGSTSPAKREEKRHAKADVAEDKKIVKKAVAQHEGAKHKGEEKTELKLKEGGRSKKDKPSVKRYDSKAIKMKKDASDKKAIAKIKKTKPVVERMTPAPAEPAAQGMGAPMEYSDDMGLQGFADGSQVPQMDPGMAAYMPPQPDRGRMRPRPMPNTNMGGIGRPMPMPNTNMGGIGRPTPMPNPNMGGMGAGAMGSMSDQERAILQGLQAVGSYCSGGKA